MTISKEERAELRRQLGDEVPDHLWPDLPDHAIDLLDALDASDERISVLESENRRALELVDVGLAETAKWQGHLERTEDKLNARIAELEAAAQWRPMSEAPKDGTWIIVVAILDWKAPRTAGDGAVVVSARFVDGGWYAGEDLSPFSEKTVNACWRWLPIPALPEGGA